MRAGEFKDPVGRYCSILLVVDELELDQFGLVPLSPMWRREL
jgi:hypothetical protein